MESNASDNGVAHSSTTVLNTAVDGVLRNSTIVHTGVTVSVEEYRFKTFQSSMNLLAHLLIGIVSGVSLLYAFRNGLPLGSTPLHIVLCVLGYQLLMAEAILSLSPHNGWSAHLKLVDKRRAHWILQILGSVLAIAGSVVKFVNKTSHWNTYHGQFALVALVFTIVSLVNGITSLWAYEFRRCIPPKVSKLSHICFGIVAFAAAGIALCYGFEKGSFKTWSGEGMCYTLIAFTSCFTFILIINPFISIMTKIKNN